VQAFLEVEPGTASTVLALSNLEVRLLLLNDGV